MAFSKRLTGIMLFICFMATLSLTATFTVSKDGRGAYSTIQAAINAAQPGDSVKILDAATYPEQVTIDSTKNGLTLTSSNPTALNKPKIVWQDIVNVHPKTYAESQIDSLINYDKNGALRILSATNITVNGIAIDGGGPYVYGYGCVWFNATDLVSGNAALTIWVSGGAHITNCDLSNAYFGIYLMDQNKGGIFANANPADLQPQNIVPMFGFGRTGNHIIEYNRIHNNSFGLWFESSWDLGSTVRYNLIYENHHQTPAFAMTVSTSPSGNNCGGDGKNQPGGALFFRDVAYSPLSICNNTFWHNYLIFVGGWRPGAPHLIFNNIYAKPFEYWSTDPTYSNDSYMEMSPSFSNRMYNCIFSCQSQALQQYYAPIMNGMPQVQGVNYQPPTQGSILSTNTVNQAFPAAANIRWIEMDSSKFQSMDPATANFLAPNWSDTLVAIYIKNQGWQKSGVKNMDGSWADIGAVSSDGGRPTDLATIVPIDPVSITGTNATIKFAIDQRIGQFQNPSAKLVRYVSNLPTVANWDPAKVIAAADINDITIAATPAMQAVNTSTVTIPVAQTADYGFFEMILEGKGSDGNLYTTSTGFLPYRNLKYKFAVQIWNSALTKQLDSVAVGDTVILKVVPENSDGSAFTNALSQAQECLYSGFTLWSTASNPMAQLTFPQGITGATTKPVEFTKVPSGGIEIVSMAGICRTSTDTAVFQGSAVAHVIGGAPATVFFQDPPSKTYNNNVPPSLNQGRSYSGNLFVFDKYGNKAGISASVTLSCLTPSIANFVGGNPDLTINTDSTGTGYFAIATTSAALQGNLVSLRAFIPTVNAIDTAYMIVGNLVTGAKNNPNFILPGKRHIDITGFNFLGRIVFHTVTDSYAGSLQAKDFQNLLKNRISSGALIVRLSVNDGGSNPFTSFYKIIAPY
jgi:hypothetical protein